MLQVQKLLFFYSDYVSVSFRHTQILPFKTKSFIFFYNINKSLKNIYVKLHIITIIDSIHLLKRIMFRCLWVGSTFDPVDLKIFLSLSMRLAYTCISMCVMWRGLNHNINLIVVLSPWPVRSVCLCVCKRQLPDAVYQ